MTREHYASLDQLRPGDVVVWTVGGRAEERVLSQARRLIFWSSATDQLAHADSDEVLLRWRDGTGDRVNASVLVRRTRRAEDT